MSTCAKPVTSFGHLTPPLAALAALNFFLADAQDGLGPFLDAYLITKGWTPFDLGVLAAIGGLVGIVGGAPAGAFVDATCHKRTLIIAPIILITLLAFAAIAYPIGFVVFTTQFVTSVVGLVIGPAVMAITLGLVGRRFFSRQISRNAVWNHAGNILLLGGTYLASRWGGISGVGALMVGITIATVVAVLVIDRSKIDHAVARGLSRKTEGIAPTNFKLLLSNRVLFFLAGTLMIFHFGNAPIARLISQQFAIGMNQPFQTTAIITCVGQISAIIGAMLAPYAVERIGVRWVLFLALGSLPIRGIIAAKMQGFAMIYPVQALDGIGAGLLGILTPLVVERLLTGTGHFNFGLAAVLTVQGLGAASSNIVAGFIVDHYDYGTAYLFHGLVAVLAVALFMIVGKEIERSDVIH
jgi:predicted MFS family arabinose efflux permease